MRMFPLFSLLVSAAMLLACSDGKDGRDGVDGIAGADGLDGEQGVPGEKGDKGDPGAQGEKGDKGDPGEKGDKGDKGDPGEPGKDGKDAEVVSYCGTVKYDPSEQFCYGIKLVDLCGGVAYDPKTHFCSSQGEVVEKCGGAAYDVESQFCDLGLVQNGEICNGELFNPRTQFCSEGSVAEKSADLVDSLILTVDSLYLMKINFDRLDTVAVDMGVRSQEGNRVLVAVGNLRASSLVLNKVHFDIMQSPETRLVNHWYKSGDREWDMFGWADITGLKTSSVADDYPSATPPVSIFGDPKYDIVAAQIGGNWRLPSSEEFMIFEEGASQDVSFRYVQRNGTYGMEFTNKVLGTSVFFAFLGYVTDVNQTVLKDYAGRGLYWVGSLSSNISDGSASARFLDLRSEAYINDLGYMLHTQIHTARRSHKFNIRPVYELK